jgi:hypothetical protein
MEYKIKIGTSLKISTGIFNSRSLVYCGMPNEETFVLAPLKYSGHAGFSPNIYYPSNSKRITFFDLAFEVKEVTRDYIILVD